MGKHIDLVGKRYGKLIVLEYCGKSKWLCQCDCGNTIVVTTSHLNSNHTRSCGCFRYDKPSHTFKDLIGKKFGRLLVLKRLENNKYSRAVWLCQCDCGKSHIVEGSHLLNGTIKSCGCYNIDRTKETHTKHGLSKSKIYSVLHTMINRCYNSNDTNYPNYGGRGITVCDEWLDKANGFMNFYNWAMQNGYDENAPRGQCTIGRIDVNGNYEPSNCRWVDMKVQANNTRTNRYMTFNGITRTLKEWSDYLNISYKCLESRLRRGWSIEKTLTAPLKGNTNDK